MHQHPGHFRIGQQRRHRGIGATAGNVVDDPRTAAQGRARDISMHGVDADGNAFCGKGFDDGDDTGRLDLRVDPRGAGPGRLSPDVDDVGAVGHQGQTLRHGPVGI